MKQKIILLGLSLYIVGCSSKQSLDIKGFSGIPFFISQTSYKKTIDSLIRYDRKFSLTNYTIKRTPTAFVRFREYSRLGQPYYGFLVPTFRKGLLVELTIFYSNDGLPELMAENLFEGKQWMLVWESGQNTFKLGEDELLPKLYEKYGTPIKTDTIQHKSQSAIITKQTREWRSDGLSVKLLEETDNPAYWTFATYIIRYAVTEEFLKKNASEIEKLSRAESIY